MRSCGSLAASQSTKPVRTYQMIVSGTLKRIRDLKLENGKRLASVLKSTDKDSFSERHLAEMISAKQALSSDVYEKGWYDPPPDGVITAFGKPKENFQRIAVPSFREEAAWPSSDVLYEQEDIIAVYASPVCRTTHLIGDFGLCLYRGNDPSVWEHFENSLRQTLEIAAFARAGMTFSEYYQKADAYIREKGFMNTTPNSMAALGANIGHTIPLSFEGDDTLHAIRHANDFVGVRTCISRGRRYICTDEGLRIGENMAFVVEPRLAVPDMPAVFFHVTVLVENGDVSICHGFNPVFESFGMDRLTRYLSV